MIFLEPGADTFAWQIHFQQFQQNIKVISGSKKWWANCAWDFLGISAALKIDVQIEASYSDNKDTVELQVNHGVVDGKSQIIYFPLPCRQWYGHLIFT